ncbi:MAG: hypothetical protein ABI867_09035 [Kofleriaceae bacterium]
MAKNKQNKVFAPDGRKLEDEEFVGERAPDTDPEPPVDLREAVHRRGAKREPGEK